MDDSAIMCNEIIKSYKEEQNFNEKKATCQYLLLFDKLLRKAKSFITISLQKQQIKINYILKMSNKVKVIDKKNRTYFFFDIINIKNFDPNNIKIDERSYKKIFLFTTLDM